MNKNCEGVFLLKKPNFPRCCEDPRAMLRLGNDFFWIDLERIQTHH
jgi:hypothetical protein